MNDSLARYGQNQSETKEQSLSRQFYEWERRGRGWQVHEFAVELEPPFRPFYYFEPSPRPLVDDGRIPTFLSRLADGFSGSANYQYLALQRQVKSANEQQREYEEYLAEIDEPKFCGYYQDDFEELQIFLPNDFTSTKPVAEQLLLSLAYASHPVSFEVIGNSENIAIQFAATQNDTRQLRQQLEAHLPGCLIRRRAEDRTRTDDYLSFNWINSADAAFIVDFGLSNEFFLPLDSAKVYDTDPLTAVVGAMSNLGEDEIAVFQVLFQKAKHDWPQEVINTIRLFEDTEFFSHIPNIVRLINQKLDSPLFAVVLRIATKGHYDERAWQIARNVGGSLASFANPAGNEFIPLSNDEYDPGYHEQALLNRQSFRCGMLLNVQELVSLVHPPSPSVQSQKLIRQSGRTKPAPPNTISHKTVLGDNVHQGESTRVTLSADQRTRHMHVLGSSGSGKSTFLLSLIKQDLENGEGLCVVDPHGDLIDEVIANVPESRLNDVILFDPSDTDFPIGFNILQARSEQEKTILASDLVATFRRMSTSWGDVMDSVLANAVLAFVENTQGGTLFDLKRFLVEKGFRDEILKSLTDDSIRYFWQHEFPLIANKPHASILIRLDAFLRQKRIRNIVCQKDTKLDFRRIMDERKVLLVKLSQGLIGEENGYLLGTLLVSRLYQAALGRQNSQDRPHFWLYLDEFQHFVTPSMENILTGSRKYNLGLVLAHQEFRQLQSRSQEVASSVLSNCYTRVCFRLGDCDAVRFAGGFSFFDARALQNLAVGEAIARVERAEFDFNLQVTPPPKVDAFMASRVRSAIVRSTHERYAKSRPEVEDELFVEKTVNISTVEEPTSRMSVENAFDKTSRSAKKKETLPTHASGQHRYLQSIVKRVAENKGFVATIEREVFGGVGRIDIALENETCRIACEIAVTNTVEYELQNIQKCLHAGFDKVVIVSDDTRHLGKIKTGAEAVLKPEQIPRVCFLEPENVHLFLDSLATSNSEDSDQKKVKGYEVRAEFLEQTESDSKTKKQVILEILSNALRRKGPPKDD